MGPPTSQPGSPEKGRTVCERGPGLPYSFSKSNLNFLMHQVTGHRMRYSSSLGFCAHTGWSLVHSSGPLWIWPSQHSVGLLRGDLLSFGDDMGWKGSGLSLLAWYTLGLDCHSWHMTQTWLVRQKYTSATVTGGRGRGGHVT